MLMSGLLLGAAGRAEAFPSFVHRWLTEQIRWQAVGNRQRQSLPWGDAVPPGLKGVLATSRRDLIQAAQAGR
jgi:hypothetical protein